MSPRISHVCSRQLLDFERDEFIRYASEYAAYGRRAGVEIIPFRRADVPHFSALSSAARRQVLNALRTCVSICISTIRNSTAVGDSRAIIWQAIKMFNLRPPSDLFSIINSESIIEMHSPDGLQIFRSFSFYRLCTYTLEELFCKSWLDLYGRDDESVNQEIQRDLGKIYSGEVMRTFPSSVRPHTVFELLSPLRFSVHLKIKYWAPLFEGRTPVASVVIEDARAIHALDCRTLERV